MGSVNAFQKKRKQKFEDFSSVDSKKTSFHRQPPTSDDIKRRTDKYVNYDCPNGTISCFTNSMNGAGKIEPAVGDRFTGIENLKVFVVGVGNVQEN
ncbi:hypothetical protein CEXT_673091 [Caerostris extrusa]|uniref:Uncharacterized protein n=1 Tax=Caerostris extrusa TaxID=172846 RepID=A0AAV4VYQ1_CAEEX|nr:hypothetical protein CEXT_673091 [Caerostris extrusa]